MPDLPSRQGFSELLYNEETYMSHWCEVAEYHGVSLYRNTDLPTHLFNFVTRLWNFPSGPCLLEKLASYYDAHGLPHRLFIGPNEPRELAYFLLDRGFVALSERLILTRDLTLVPQTVSRDVHVEAISQSAEVEDWVRTAIQSWTHPSFPNNFDRIVSTIVADGVASFVYRD